MKQGGRTQPTRRRSRRFFCVLKPPPRACHREGTAAGDSDGARGWLVWSRQVETGREEDWLERLAAAGFGSALALAEPGRATVRLELWLEDDAAGRLVRDRWAQEWGGEFGGRWRSVPDCDWVAANSRPRPPLKIRDQLVILDRADPVARAGAEARGRKVLVVPAGMAFGTGDHATTSTVLRWLADEAVVRRATGTPGWSFLDIGCGTGILALAAAALGAARVEGFDFDPVAVAIARDNAAANGIDGVRLGCCDLLQWSGEREGGWDVVAANVYGPVLVQAMPQLAAATAAGGVLLLSGILDSQRDTVVAAATTAGLRIDREQGKGKWVTLAARPG